MADELDKEYRAWELLRWSTPAEIAPFDEELADAGFYTKVQFVRSEKALDDANKAVDSVAVVELKRTNPRTELEAFRELMRLGVLSEEVFFSPDKAAGRPRKLPGSEQTKPTEETYLEQFKRHKRGLQRQQPVDGRNEEGLRLRVSDDHDLRGTRQVARPTQLRGRPGTGEGSSGQ